MLRLHTGNAHVLRSCGRNRDRSYVITRAPVPQHVLGEVDIAMFRMMMVRGVIYIEKIFSAQLNMWKI